jgi:hypothetical protein
MSNSGTSGLSGMMMEVISNESLDVTTRKSAAANLYSLIQRSWNPEVRILWARCFSRRQKPEVKGSLPSLAFDSSS